MTGINHRNCFEVWECHDRYLPAVMTDFQVFPTILKKNYRGWLFRPFNMLHSHALNIGDVLKNDNSHLVRYAHSVNKHSVKIYCRINEKMMYESDWTKVWFPRLFSIVILKKEKRKRTATFWPGNDVGGISTFSCKLTFARLSCDYQRRFHQSIPQTPILDSAHL